MGFTAQVILCLFAADGLTIPAGLDAYLPVPDANPLTREKVALGKKLFFDPKLSRDGSMSCATCHDPKLAFTDARPLGIGVGGQVGDRRVPRIVNRGYGKSFFWDGRVQTLEEQVLQPILNPKEMDLTRDEITKRTGLAAEVVSHSLASYVRTIFSGDSPYDRYLQGNRDALTAEQRAGLRLFRSKAGCTACHLGPNFTDERLHNTGAGWPADRGAFKTPSLREVARTPPYMHNGSLKTIEEVIDFYDKGGKANPALDPEMRELDLTAEEKKALAAFLQTLNGTVRDGM